MKNKRAAQDVYDVALTYRIAARIYLPNDKWKTGEKHKPEETTRGKSFISCVSRRVAERSEVIVIKLANAAGERLGSAQQLFSWD